MNEKFQELKELYQSIYNNTYEISSLIEKGVIDDIQNILDQRGELIKKTQKIIISTSFSEDEKKEINNLIAKIKSIEENNQEKMEKRKDFIKKELSKLNINQKAITAYKYEKDSDPRLIDSKE
ncbi:MAG: hypothetical protein A2255_04545 [Candidatus Melainabacteria bacterium RIFOXYA2_FULL_32_9]|nr:MAG: hypothetical protein A2255_04545 [Candidatus Melainabacteria bacterium RIFOXYA2_FULL_32_9]